MDVLMMKKITEVAIFDPDFPVATGIISIKFDPPIHCEEE